MVLGTQLLGQLWALPSWECQTREDGVVLRAHSGQGCEGKMQGEDGERVSEDFLEEGTFEQRPEG